MGGRGSYSYSGKRSAKDGSTLSAYAVASLNKGTAGGTTVESAKKQPKKSGLLVTQKTGTYA